MVGVRESAETEIDAGPATLPEREGPPLMPLGQFRDTFIVAVDNDGIAIIDQHVAHERILYERFRDAAKEKKIEVVSLGN